jgi:hypothetical protein
VIVIIGLGVMVIHGQQISIQKHRPRMLPKHYTSALIALIVRSVNDVRIA